MKTLAYLFKIIFSYLILLTFFRLIFFLLYYQVDAEISLKEIFVAFLIGIRFDLATIMLLIILPFSIIILNISPKRHLNKIEFVLQLILFFMICIIIIDFLYYKYAHKKVGFEIFIFLNDPIEFFKFGFKSFWYIIALVPVLFFLQKKLWSKFFTIKDSFDQTSFKSRIIFFVFFIFLAVTGIRGGWQGRPLKPVMAFQNDSCFLAHLAMNGAYNILTAIYKSNHYPVHKNWKESISLLQKMLGNSKEKFISEKYPFYRKFEPKKTPLKKNVVLIVMESWGFSDLGYSGHPRKSTPFFDKLLKKGMLFTRHYANGPRTIIMISSVASSIPPLFGNVYTTSSYQNNRQTSLASILKDYGYSTLFAYSAKKNSMGFSSYATRSGFDEVITKDSFDLSKVEQDGVWGVYDEYTFDKILSKIRKIPPPFFVMMETIHPHLPYSVPSHQKKNFPGKLDFYDDMRYTDMCLERFLNSIRKEPFFKNTLFVILGDHAYGEKKGLDLYHTPLLFYSPGFISPSKKSILASHVDIMPTILDILNIQTKHSSMGKSLISEVEMGNWAILDMDHLVGFMRGNYILISDENKAISFYDFIQDPQLKNNLFHHSKYSLIQKTIKKEWEVYSSAIGYSIMNDKIVPEK